MTVIIIGMKSDVDHPIMDYTKLQASLRLDSAKSEVTCFSAIVDAPFVYKTEAALLFLGAIMLALVDKERKVLQAKAISQTDFVKDMERMAGAPADAITQPYDADENLVVKAIKSGKPQGTSDWGVLMSPAVPAAPARLIQASGGIAFTSVYPLKGVGTGGALVYSFFRRDVSDVAGQNDFMRRYTALVSELLKT
jgi:hypothetical protein